MCCIFACARASLEASVRSMSHAIRKAWNKQQQPVKNKVNQTMATKKADMIALRNAITKVQMRVGFTKVSGNLGFGTLAGIPHGV